MNQSGVTVFFEARERIDGDRSAVRPDFSRPSVEIDLSRPPEPGTFRFSLETMRRSAPAVSRRPLLRPSGQAPLKNRDDARNAPRRPDKQASVHTPPERRPPSSEETGSSRRSAETREPEPESSTDREGACDRSQDVSGTQEKTPRTVPAAQQGDAGGAEGSGQWPQETTAAQVPAGESAAKTAGDGQVPPATGSPCGDAGAVQAVSPHVAGQEGVSQTEPSAKPDTAQPAAQERAGGSKKNAAASAEKMPAEKQAGRAGKSAVAPSPGGSAGTETAATATRTSATTSAKVAPGNTALQVDAQATPAVAPRETAAPAAQTSGGITAALKESSAGRVVRIGADTQSGQTGLFQAHQGPTGGIQAGGSTSAPPAPGQPFQHELLQQVTEKTVFHLRNGRAEARIDLKPESLGHLRLHVSTDNGQVTLKIMTESSWVRDMIESNIGHLKSELQQHNLQIDRLAVSVSGGGQESAGGNPQNAASPRTPADTAATGRGESAADAGEEEVRHPSAQRIREGLVDYFA